MVNSKYIVPGRFVRLSKTQCQCDVDKLDAETCQLVKCGKVMGDGRHGLHYHLTHVHKLKLDNPVEESAPKRKQCLITSYFPSIDNSREATIARMVSSGRFTLAVFAEDSDLRRIFAKSYSGGLPNSANTIRSILLSYKQKIREMYTEYLQDHILNGGRFTITIDEWTSNNSKRYLNIILNLSGNRVNLGLARITGSPNAANCKIAIENRLDEFSLSVDRVHALSSDGASVMKALANLMNKISQLCFLHAIHLAVTKTLYNVKKKTPDPINQEIDDAIDVLDDFSQPIEIITDTYEFIDDQKKEIIVRVRNIIKRINSSPENRETLSQKVIAELGENEKQRTLTLDSKNRWDSMYKMLRIFNQLQTPIEDATSEINKQNKKKYGKRYTAIPSLSPSDFIHVEEMLSVLKPVHHCITSLSKHQLNLFEAECYIVPMLDELRSMEDNEFAKTLYSKLVDEISVRRTAYGDALIFLKHRTFKFDHFDQFSDDEMLDAMLHVLETENRINNNDESSLIQDRVETLQSKRIKTDYYEKVNELLEQAESNSFNRSDVPTREILQDEINRYKLTGSKSDNLQTIQIALELIRPTSIECEQCFSICRRTLTEFRCNMSDPTLDAIIFLQAHFNRINKLYNLMSKNG